MGSLIEKIEKRLKELSTLKPHGGSNGDNWPDNPGLDHLPKIRMNELMSPATYVEENRLVGCHQEQRLLGL